MVFNRLILYTPYYARIPLTCIYIRPQMISTLPCMLICNNEELKDTSTSPSNGVRAQINRPICNNLKISPRPNTKHLSMYHDLECKCR